MLKYQAFKFSRMIVKRVWTKIETDTQIHDNEKLCIWDGGAIRHERWPDGTEHTWEVMGREASQDGFTETLRERMAWQVPGVIQFREQLQLRVQSEKMFEIPGWQISQTEEVADANCNIDRNDRSASFSEKQPPRPRFQKHPSQGHRLRPGSQQGPSRQQAQQPGQQPQAQQPQAHR